MGTASERGLALGRVPQAAQQKEGGRKARVPMCVCTASSKVENV